MQYHIVSGTVEGGVVAILRKLVERFLAEPPDVTFAEVQTLLGAFGYRERPAKGSHHVFVRPGHPIVTVPLVDSMWKMLAS